MPSDPHTHDGSGSAMILEFPAGKEIPHGLRPFGGPETR